MKMELSALAASIDHTLLKPSATKLEIERLCLDARKYRFHSVCVQPYWVPFVRQYLVGQNPAVCTVVGFPHGSTIHQHKQWETEQVVSAGADEVDMVINLPALFDNEWSYIEQEISNVVTAAQGRLVKVILETCLLTEQQIVKACLAAKTAGAHFVKTSTGFSGQGATLSIVQLMRTTVGEQMGVKASGGIRDRETAMRMIEAGATRLGTSNSIAIVSAKE